MDCYFTRSLQRGLADRLPLDLPLPGLISREEELEWRNEVDDDTVKRQIIEYLERPEVSLQAFLTHHGCLLLTLFLLPACQGQLCLQRVRRGCP